MRFAALRILFFTLLALLGASGSAALAGGLDPIGTVTSAVSTVAGSTTIVSDLTGGGDATAPVSEAESVISGGLEATSGGGDSSTSSATSSASETSNGSEGAPSDSGSSAGSSGARRITGARTRFDRLPRLYETLLERVELGRNVEANIARLRTLLASASPELRVRILRLIHSEIARLERGGLTRRERAAARRLGRLMRALDKQDFSTSWRAPALLVRLESTGIGSLQPTVFAGPGATEWDPRLAYSPSPNDESSSGRTNGAGALLHGAPPTGSWYWLVLVLLTPLVCALLFMSIESFRRVPLPIWNAAAARASELRALALTLALAGCLGLWVLFWMLA